MFDLPGWLVDFFGDITLAQVVIWVAVAAVVVILVRRIWPGVVAAVKLTDMLSKLPAFMERTDAAIRKQGEQLDGIYHETHRNDGSSIKDSTVRLEHAVAELGGSVQGVHGRLDALEQSDKTQTEILTDVQDKLHNDHDRIKQLEDTHSRAELEQLRNPNGDTPS